ncbi:hypothetical protein B0H10DRAFT_2058676 [Mycena sp. CBHHK59/15]|nr:hypothetical protein B0H10DRAFT_2058676 [Mycena sp. CBHHK59/15]
MQQPGLLEWCNSTRFTMANDPGRQLFRDQIQTHGFLFLNDYLHNILAGPQRKLVKTPGRKKTTSKKLIQDETDSKENVAPVNRRPMDTIPEQTKASLVPHKSYHSPPVTTPDVFDIPLCVPSPKVASSDLPQESGVDEPQLLNAPPVDQNDLSMIVEDDETDRSRASLRGNEINGFAAVDGQPNPQSDNLPEHIPGHVDHIVASSPSTATFQSIALSPVQPEESSATVASRRHSQSPNAQNSAPLRDSSVEIRSSTENYTAPLPEIPPWHSRTYDDAVTEPLPSLTMVKELAESSTEILDSDSKVAPPSPKGLTHKASVPSFPSFPAPLPFRKSIRAPPDSSVAQGPLGAATPGAALGGKRTSWLMRAREVKALEITVKKMSPAPSTATAVAGSSKRKSGDMFAVPGLTGLEDDERRPKVAKNTESDIAPLKPKPTESESPKMTLDQDALIDRQPPHRSEAEDGEQEGLLVKLKRTVDGLGARVGKSMGKSLGGAAAANALAEARAAAEARIAERHHKEEEATLALGIPSAAPLVVPTATVPSDVQQSSERPPVFHSSGSYHRLSVSELVTSAERKGKTKEVDIVVELASSALPSATSRIYGPREDDMGHTSTTTTPPDSPAPPTFPIPSGPVFNKPPPVFVAPAPTSQAKTFKLPMSTAFSIASMTLGLAPRLPSPKSTVPLSAQSTMESIRSEACFDSQDDAPAWMPSTQDTDYTSGFGSQSQCSPPHGPMTELDEDDSWPMDEKLAAGVQWTFGGKEDSLTWSTLPTESQRADTGPIPQDDGVTQDHELNVSSKNEREFQTIPRSFNMDIDEYEGDGDVIFDEDVLDEMEIDPKKSTISLVNATAGRSESQMSMASTASSQSQVGFLGHASKLMSSVLGTGKKGKPEVKSLQLAAVAAKKQQEEKEKKANRLKEMENRRQAALQRKADEEKAKAQEEERRLKEESDRRKKDREEHTDKRPLKIVGAKKVMAEAEKKPEMKKPALKPVLNASTSTKPKPTFVKPQSALASSAAYNTASTSKVVETNLPKSTAAQGKGKLATKNMVPDDDLSQPSQILQTQMAARAKAQLQAANMTTTTIASESIELPDINSEYSDSDDEDRPRTFDPPSWAQSPDLRQALQVQSTINPDAIFGAIRPLRMDELFRTRTGRFRARTSSANWTGTDRLTVEEEREYARRMGFR